MEIQSAPPLQKIWKVPVGVYKLGRYPNTSPFRLKRIPNANTRPYRKRHKPEGLNLLSLVFY
ncbi:hypothetical protein [Candidatus Coxiella mudrowiae]|uniref:hypothetical protein n=1 Tax=Candidatus Coxiella mudrowiae TaxID=2054173 RepID=UPI000C2831A6|nr:hypothetical protein [Candidatus Coxiella mudrowiae]